MPDVRAKYTIRRTLFNRQMNYRCLFRPQVQWPARPVVTMKFLGGGWRPAHAQLAPAAARRLSLRSLLLMQSTYEK